MESKKFLNAEEVAAEFGLSAESLQQFVDAGEVRALADRGTWKYRRDELEGLVSAGRILPPAIDLDSLADSGQTLSFSDPEDDLSYIELDEDALAEQATMITKSGPAAPVVPDAADEEDWFVPSEAAEMNAGGNQSSSDVAIYSGPEEASSEDDGPSVTEGSDSDVQIAPEYDSVRPEDSGILLDFNVDAGATVSSSGSSLRLPQTAGALDDLIADAGAEVEAEGSAWDDIPETAETGDSGLVGVGDASGINLEGDSGVNLVDLSGSGVKLPTEESGILLEEDSRLGITAGSSVVRRGGDSVLGAGVGLDSGIALDSDDQDSGITLEDSQAQDDPDSGITLSAGDSGIALFAGDSGIALSDDDDSGIALGSLDSGLSLQGADSGLMLSGDSGLAIDGNARTMADDDLSLDLDGDRTQTLDLSGELEDDSAFDINLDEGDATAELLLDDDDADETSATVIRKGRPAPGSLSAAFELDDGAEVEDLEISQDLDAGIEDDVEEFADDEVFESSEETFSDEVESTDDEDYLEPAAVKKPTGPKEPAWGAGMVVGLVACSLFLAANTLVLLSGVSTMWSGADIEGPAASLIESLAGLM